MHQTSHDAKAEPLNGGQMYMCGLLALVYTCHIVDRTIILVLLEPIKHEFALSDSQLGLVSGFIFALGTLVAAMPLGTLADRYSRKLLLALCVAVWSGMTLLCGLAVGFVSLLLFRLLVGAAEAGLQPSAMSMVADATTPGQRTKAIAIVHFGLPVGILTGFIVGGWVAANLGWRQALILVGLPGLILAALVALTLKEPPRQVQSQRGGADELSLGAFFALLWRSKPLLHVVAGMIILWLGTSSKSAWMSSFFVRVHGQDVATVGLIMAFGAGVGGLVGNSFSGWLAQKYGAGRRDRLALIAMIGACGYFPLSLLTLLTPSLVVSVLTHMIQNIFYFMVFTPGYSLAMDIADARIRARTAALVSMGATAIGYGLGPQIVGVLSDLFQPYLGAQSLRWALVTMMVVMLWCAGHFLVAWRGLRRAQVGAA